MTRTVQYFASPFHSHPCKHKIPIKVIRQVTGDKYAEHGELDGIECLFELTVIPDNEKKQPESYFFRLKPASGGEVYIHRAAMAAKRGAAGLPQIFDRDRLLVKLTIVEHA